MILVFQRERERDIIMKILETLNGKVMHLEDQPAPHRPTMHPEEDQLALKVYGVNCASVVGISRSTTLFSSLLPHSAYYVRFLFLNCVCYLMPLWFLAGAF